jgi:polyisoprenoid-binding protein YceI
MKRQFILITALCALPFTGALAATEHYTLDPNHTAVVWQINHFGFSTQLGKLYATGTLEFDPVKIEQSKVNVTINIAKDVTGLPELDKHLKGELFFNTAKYPTATFVSDKIDLTGKDTGNMQGTLTLHGVKKPITLAIKINKNDMNPITNKMTIGFNATASLKRSDFGMSTMVPTLGDDVQLIISGEAYKGK